MAGNATQDNWREKMTERNGGHVRRRKGSKRNGARRTVEKPTKMKKRRQERN